MKAGTKRTDRSIFAIVIAALWRVLISSPRVMAGELPPANPESRSGPEFHVVADDLAADKDEQLALTGNDRHRSLALDENVLSAPTVESRINVCAMMNGGPHGFTPQEVSTLVTALNSGVNKPSNGPPVMIVLSAVMTSGVAAIMIIWFRRAPAAAT